MKVFITAQMTPESLQKLRDLLQDEVFYESWCDTKNMYFDAEELVSKLKEYKAEIFICEGDNVKKDVLENVDLKIIGSTRDDPNNIDLITATKKGIPVLFTPGRNKNAVTELTITLMLALMRKVHKISQILHSDQFKVDEFTDYVDYYNLFKGNELKGKIIGIIGLGNVGFEVAKRLKGFDVEFLIYDPYVQESRLRYINGELVDLNTLMTKSDIISIHCPPTDETDGLIGQEQIDLMKSSAFIINLGRASITDEDALYQALKVKKIAGAAIDVFNIEPVDQYNEFLELENVIVTPHIGGDTFETIHNHSMMIVEGIEKLMNNEIPSNIINPEVLPGYSADTYSLPEKGEEIPITLSSYKTESNEILNICKMMVEKGLIVGTAGNVSMRIKFPNGDDGFLLTPSTVSYEDMTVDDMVIIDKNLNVIVGTRNPTSEKHLHVNILQSRRDVNAVIHSHAPYSTILSIARIPLGPIVDEIIPFIGGCEVAQYGMAGTEEISQKALVSLGNNYAVFLPNHGNVCIGTDIKHAYTVLQLVEFAAKIQYRASLLGTIYALPEEAENDEKEMFEIMREANDMG
ncbi:MAG: class II aldolase/adducin family protein [Candidatus Lokiarchaeota archaeon]|nr:class II aldolase/adducin family protein [Candidatus Lokiarchaeota archaeon]